MAGPSAPSGPQQQNIATSRAARVVSVFADLDTAVQPGCAVAATRDGKMLHVSAHGYADLENRIPITPATVFNIASTSKQFTAFSLLLLESQGKLSLDDSILKHIPELGEYARPVTLRHLLHHTGGLRDYVQLLAMQGRTPDEAVTQRETLDVLARQRAANAPPGTEYGYSNTGYFLLGVVIERRSGMRLRQFAEQNIFEPLGMRSTTIVEHYPTLAFKRVRGNPVHDVVIRGGSVYDGYGKPPFIGDVVIDGDRISYVGTSRGDQGRTEIDARNKAVAPGFINMLSWAVDTLLVDGTGSSDLHQGVTLEVFGEGSSMGPLNDDMKRTMRDHQGDIRYDVSWTTLGEYLEQLERRGIAPNVASFIGATTPRLYVLGSRDVDPDASQLRQMRKLVHQSMEEGALGVASSLIYVPGSFAKTNELVALAQQAGQCGGIYVSHMRSEGDRLLEAVDETIDIARRAGAPAEIYHLKAAGERNWSKLDDVVRRIEQARAGGTRITADMYPYTAGATGLSASMPPWVQEGGLDEWVSRLKNPEIRTRVVAEMREPESTWENLYRASGGAQHVLLTEFKSEKLKPLAGKTLAEVARIRGVSPEDAAIDLVIEDRSRVEVVYFMMSEGNVRRQLGLPFMSFASDAPAPAPAGVFLKSSVHPRAYGTFARVLGKYVREEKVVPLEEAVRRLTAFPAANLGLRERGALRAGYFADVVVFDPDRIIDHATYQRPHQYATGVSHVLVNGKPALENGEPTGRATGRVVRGRAWKGWPDGGCRASSREWSWAP